MSIPIQILSMALLLLIIALLDRNLPVNSIVLNSSLELQYYFCNQSIDTSSLILELNSSIQYNISKGQFCVLRNIHLTIHSTASKQVEICCAIHHHPHSSQGIAFINSTIILQQVTFSNCGTYLKTLPDDIVNVFNSSYLHYTSNHSAALLFIQCTVNMSEVVLTSSYGFAVIGINLIDSFLHRMSVTGSAVSTEVYSHNKKIIGSGILLHFLDNAFTFNITKVSISDSIFSQHVDLFLTSCITPSYKHGLHHWQEFHVVHAAGLTILYTQNYIARVDIARTFFTQNFGSSSGAMLILHYNNSTESLTNIDNSCFDRNANWVNCHGAALQFYWFGQFLTDKRNNQKPLIISSTLFQKHLQILDDMSLLETNHSTGAVYISIVNPSHTSLNISFTNCTFHKNKVAYTGACLFASVYKIGGNIIITMENITANTNSQDLSFPTVSHAGMFTFYAVNKVIINGTKNTFRDNFGSVIHAKDSNVYLYGDIEFINNKGTTGAAINIVGYSHLHLMRGLNATFSNNQVQFSGGAIYAIADYHEFEVECAILIDNDQIKLRFSNNSAKYTGNSIFATPLYNCVINESLSQPPQEDTLSIYHKHFDFDCTSHLCNNSLLNLSTDPQTLLVYNHNNTEIYSTLAIIKFPGETFTIHLAAVDVARRFVYSTVGIDVVNNDSSSDSSHLWLPQEQNEGIILEGKNISIVSLSIHTDINDDIINSVLIFSLPLRPVHPTIKVKLLPCPLGFILNNISGSCECSKAFLNLQKHVKRYDIDFQCSITNHTITSSRYFINLWMGAMVVNNVTIFGVSLICPLGHCSNNPMNPIFLSEGDSMNFNSLYVTDEHLRRKEPLCLYNREGTLCGKCKDVNGHRYSRVVGSPECRKCSNIWLLMILLYIFLALLLVYLLYALRLTLTTGTLNGIIFFAQAANCGFIDFLNNAVFDERPVLKYMSRFCVEFLSIINLNNGFPMCVFNGMTEMYRMGFILIPAFLLLAIIVFIILLSCLSVRFSNKISHSSVQVLVTLVHLSFSKLLLVIIDVFTPATIYTSDDSYHVWYWDGTVEYMSHSHCILMITSLVIVVPLLLPYTTFLLFGKFLIRHSSFANRNLRQLYEAVHGPLKENKQYWFAARLLLLIAMYIIYAIYRAFNVSIIFLFTIPLLVTFLVIQAAMKPFKNKLIFYLDSWIMFVFAFTYMTTWYYLQPATYEPANGIIICVVAVLLIFLTMLIILIGHFLWVTGHLYKFRLRFAIVKRRVKQQISSICHKTPAIVVPLGNTSDSYYGSCSQYREPILSPNP